MKSCVLSLGKWGEMLIQVSSLTPSEQAQLQHFITSTAPSTPPEPEKRPKLSPPVRLYIQQAAPLSVPVLMSVDPGSDIGKLLFEVTEKNRDIVRLRERLKTVGAEVNRLKGEEEKLEKVVGEMKATNRIE